MEAGTQDAIRDALDQLWAKFLPQMEERLRVLEAANRALEEGVLPDAQRSKAASAAHKLAGALGMFGLEEGTALAREAEVLYCEGQDPVPEAKRRLSAIAVRLAELMRAHRA